jgi:hypothetical protein
MSQSITAISVSIKPTSNEMKEMNYSMHGAIHLVPNHENLLFE